MDYDFRVIDQTTKAIGFTYIFVSILKLFDVIVVSDLYLAIFTIAGSFLTIVDLLLIKKNKITFFLAMFFLTLGVSLLIVTPILASELTQSLSEFSKFITILAIGLIILVIGVKNELNVRNLWDKQQNQFEKLRDNNVALKELNANTNALFHKVFNEWEKVCISEKVAMDEELVKEIKASLISMSEKLNTINKE